MMRRVCAGVIVLAVMGMTSVQAAIQGGEREVGGAFTYVKPSNSDGYWFLNATLAYFVNPHLRIGTTGFLFGDTDDWSGIAGGQVDYFFNEGQDVIPYIGLGVMSNVSEDPLSDILLDLHGGFKQFISERTSINYELKYLTMIGTDDDDVMDGVFIGNIGFSFYW